MYSITGVPAKNLRTVADLYARARRPMVLCGRGVTRGGSEALVGALNLVKATNRRTSDGRWRLMELAIGGNSMGARLLGQAGLHVDSFDPHTAEMAFVVLGGIDPTWPRDRLERLRTISFVVAFAPREHEVTDFANVVIPTASWAERAGTFVNLEGRVQKGRRLMDPLAACIAEEDIFERLAKAWKGPASDWKPLQLPSLVHAAGDGELLPSHGCEGGVDLAGLEALGRT
jgi:NADH-quinone oxidoreductase subunit G